MKGIQERTSTEFTCAQCDEQLRVSTAAVSNPSAKVRCPGCRSVHQLRSLAPTSPAAAGRYAPPPMIAPVQSPTGSYRVPHMPHAAPTTPMPAPTMPFARPVAGPRVTAQWEVERTDLRDRSFSATDIAEMGREGRLRSVDKIRLSGGGGEWVLASQQPQFKTPFALRLKEVESRLRSLARQDGHRCAHHGKVRAKYICTECAYPYCFSCGGGGSCPDCTTELAKL